MSKYENGKKGGIIEGGGRLQLPCQGGSFPICFCFFFFYLKENYITMSLFHDYLFLRVSNTQWYPIQDSCMTDPH